MPTVCTCSGPLLPLWLTAMLPPVKPVPGKYTLIEIDYGADEKESKKTDAAPASAEPPKPKAASKLDQRVQNFISMIFDLKVIILALIHKTDSTAKMMERTMVEMEYDVKKMPLGKVSSLWEAT